jgi:hypothetical protein
MSDLRIALTDKAVSALPLATHGQYLARDTELGGFFVLTGKTKKTFTIQGDLRRDGLRKSIRLAVGQAGEVNAREARAKAKEWLGKIARGEHPTEEANLKDHMQLLLKGWWNCRWPPGPKPAVVAERPTDHPAERPLYRQRNNAQTGAPTLATPLMRF